MGIPKGRAASPEKMHPPGGRFLNILYFYVGQASLRGGARILDSVALCASSRPPTRETQFRVRFILN